MKLSVVFTGLIYAVLLAGILPAQTVSNDFGTTDTFLAISGITEAGAPRIVDDFVVFTYESAGYSRHVGITFAHEGYRRIHTFLARKREDRQDLFYLTWRPPEGLNRIAYRYVIDGVWIVDPHASETIVDSSGVRQAILDLPAMEPHRQESPRINPDGTVTFNLYFDVRVAAAFDTVDGRYVSIEQFTNPRVSLVSSANAWDPFRHVLTESKTFPGLYSITLPERKGRYFYYFMVDGERILDPYNRRTARNPDEGYLVSLLDVP